MPRPAHCLEWVNQPQTVAELAELHACIARDSPFGSDTWRQRTAKQLGLVAPVLER